MSKKPSRPSSPTSASPSASARRFYLSHKQAGSSSRLGLSGTAHSHSQPKVLPFPDLPVRPVSRPATPAATPTASAGASRSSSRAVSPVGRATDVGCGTSATRPPHGRSLSAQAELVLVRSQRTGSGGVDSSSSGASTGTASTSVLNLGPTNESALRPMDMADGTGVDGDLSSGPSRSRASTLPSAPILSVTPPMDHSPSRRFGASPRAAAGGSSADPVSIAGPRSGSASAGLSVPMSSSTSAPGGSSIPSITSGLSPTSAPGPSSADSSSLPSSQHVPSITLAAPVARKAASGLNAASQPVPSTEMLRVASPGRSSRDGLSGHLLRSFLRGSCADLLIWVRRWGVGWKVHRVVLIQAGFFHSLFLSGFSETAVRSSKGKEKQQDADFAEWAGDVMELSFDDPNITRAAFEICLARLYYPAAQLSVSPSLIPTPACPLTRRPFVAPAISEQLSLSDLQVSPRLLLSVVATSTYFGYNDLLRESLALVLKTIGPWTVKRYLDFAIGDGIGDEEWDGQTETGLLDLVEVAISIRPPSIPAGMDVQSPVTSEHEEDDTKVGYSPTTSTRTITADSLSGGQKHSLPRTRSDLRASIASSDAAQNNADSSFDSASMPHYYGYSSDKIGESCVCWLARFAAELLLLEASKPKDHGDDGLGTLSDRWHVWGHRGLPARFVCAVLSSDLLYVDSEMERYRLARAIFDLRRHGWEEEMGGDDGDIATIGARAEETENEEASRWEAWEDDESELAKVFEQGIAYAHMSFDQLAIIASDIDLSTNEPFAPLAVLQAAHWAAFDLKTRAATLAKIDMASVDPRAVETPGKELGIGVSTADIIARHERLATARSRMSTPNSRISSSRSVSVSSHSGPNTLRGSPTIDVRYYVVPNDDTHRLGAAGLSAAMLGGDASNSLVGLPNFGPDETLDPLSPFLVSDSALGPSLSTPRKKPPPIGEERFFGLSNGSILESQIVQAQADHLRPDTFDPSRAGFSSLGLGRPSTLSQSQSSPLLPLSASPTLTSGEASKVWTPNQPFRFSLHFPSLLSLSENQRSYSPTHFYAGSWWNVYVQVIRKKDKSGWQLGVYLHRQDPEEDFPETAAEVSSGNRHDNPRQTTDRLRHPAVASTTGVASVDGGRRGTEAWTAQMAGPQGFARAQAGRDRAGSAQSALTDEMQAKNKAGEGKGEWRDERKVVKAYFSVTCFSTLGTSLLQFSSSPDSFTLSQSWGWKSSALRTEEYLGPPSSSAPHDGGSPLPSSRGGLRVDSVQPAVTTPRRSASAMPAVAHATHHTTSGRGDIAPGQTILAWAGGLGGLHEAALDGGEAEENGALRGVVVLGVV